VSFLVVNDLRYVSCDVVFFFSSHFVSGEHGCSNIRSILFVLLRAKKKPGVWCHIFLLTSSSAHAIFPGTQKTPMHLPAVLCLFLGLSKLTPKIGRYPNMSLSATPLDFVFKGYSIWLELEQVDSDLDKAVDAAAVDLDVHAIPGMSSTLFFRTFICCVCSRSQNHLLSCSSSRHGHLRYLSPL
jgi:hypothetical protein